MRERESLFLFQINLKKIFMCDNKTFTFESVAPKEMETIANNLIFFKVSE